MRKLGKFLDKKKFLNLRIWEFSYNSLSRPYNRLVLKELLLKHPLKSLKGMFSYAKFSKTFNIDLPTVTKKNQNKEGFANEVAMDPKKLIVGIGFCQKTLERNGKAGCPAGRFNHRCQYLENIEKFRNKNYIPETCKDCYVRKAGEKALKAGASFYIMTSGIDVAKHFYLPTLNKDQFKYAILMLCPFSFLPFILPLFIIDVDFYMFKYSKNACDTWERWVAADDGYKPEQTKLEEQSTQYIDELLENIILKNKDKVTPQKFKLINEVYISQS